MRSEHLPWDSVPGTVYHARELKPRKPWVTKGCWAMCIFLIFGGLVTPYKIALVFGVLYILVLLMQKDAVVTDRGLEIFYQMRITTSYTLWPWDEITAVIREDRKHPELAALHFARGNATRRFFFTHADTDAIMDLARRKAPSIPVQDATEDEMIGYRRQQRHY